MREHSGNYDLTNGTATSCHLTLMTGAEACARSMRLRIEPASPEAPTPPAPPEPTAPNPALESTRLVEVPAGPVVAATATTSPGEATPGLGDTTH